MYSKTNYSIPATINILLHTIRQHTEREIGILKIIKIKPVTTLCLFEHSSTMMAALQFKHELNPIGCKQQRKCFI